MPCPFVAVSLPGAPCCAYPSDVPAYGGRINEDYKNSSIIYRFAIQHDRKRPFLSSIKQLIYFLNHMLNHALCFASQLACTAIISPSQCASPNRPQKLPICTTITTKVSASATQLVLPAFGDLSGEGTVLGAFAKIPGILAKPTSRVNSGNYSIGGTLCEPTKHVPALEDNIQILVHGSTYTKDYWSTGAWSSKNTP